jgi:hypothetical protein
MDNETLTEPLQNPISTVDDVSPRVRELMQRIDRYPPGTYEIRIVKPEMRAAEWDIDIVRLDRIETYRLSKYHPE